MPSISMGLDYWLEGYTSWNKEGNAPTVRYGTVQCSTTVTVYVLNLMNVFAVVCSYGGGSSGLVVGVHLGATSRRALDVLGTIS